MARSPLSYRFARRAIGKQLHRKRGGGVSGHMPRVSISPVVNNLPYRLPRRLQPNPKKAYNLQAGNVPGGFRRVLAKLANAERHI